MTVAAAAEAWFGRSVQVVRGRSGQQGEIWRSDTTPPVWFKGRRNDADAAREVAAIQDWGAALGWPPGTRRHGRWVCMPHIAGGRARPSPETYERLGRRLAALHALPFEDDDPVPLADALASRARSWSRGVPTDVGRRLVRAWDTELPAMTRVPCHRDVAFWNLRMGDELRLLDLGQARPDLFLFDLVKLYQAPLRPDREDALWRGLGREREAWAGLLQRCLLLHGVATWAWGARHGDARAVEQGRRILERVDIP